MSYSREQRLPYSAFRQACRAFRPSELVPAIARASAALGEPPYPDEVTRRMPPWGLAAAARESLLYGNEYRSKPVDTDALRTLMRKFQIAMDLSQDDVRDENFLVRLLTRVTYEQFPYQESMFEELARSHAWMVEGLPDVETKVITEESLAAMLDGVPLREAIGATFFLQVGALQNGGVYLQSWLDQPNFAEVLNLYPRSNIEKMATRLTTTPAAFKAAFKEHAVGSAKAARFDYNPLVATPFVDLGDGPVAPATRLILRTVTPGGLYYAGLAAHGKAFADDLGGLFEHYIGRQLKLINGAEVEAEIVFGKGGGHKSVDWFVILPNLLILVEVKSRRLGPAARAGDAALLGSLDGTLGSAGKQLTRTVRHLAERHPAFVHIPTDRPMLGLIVTAEPFYTGPAYLLDHDVAIIPGGSLPDVPVAAASARDIESLVTHGVDIEPMLLAEIAKSSTGVVSLRDLGKKAGVENPILANAWNAYPWPARERPDES
ncbi:hypothetical protein [Saccharothrix deserti]|uniref:hypothetical protein n=1 Tax=Saccharothrix deserti TaxID=2593674 RepID=UPI00131AA61C|nr:hypothetical protein [Saccharothrix deserti]